MDLVKSGVNYVGIDISNEMLLRTRESIPEPYGGKCDLLLADAMWLPFREFSFDKALSFATLFFVPDQAKAISEIQSVARQRIAIEFRNSRNLKVYLYSKASTFSVFARPLLYELVRRDGVRKSLGLLLGRSRAQKLSDQILVYGSLQPVFGMNTAILSKEMGKNGWKVESILAYSMTEGHPSKLQRGQIVGRFKPVLVAHSIREKVDHNLRERNNDAIDEFET